MTAGIRTNTGLERKDLRLCTERVLATTLRERPGSRVHHGIGGGTDAVVVRYEVKEERHECCGTS